nr:immunoglobulin light chain junction region [Macaca mulatta]
DYYCLSYDSRLNAVSF